MTTFLSRAASRLTGALPAVAPAPTQRRPVTTRQRVTVHGTVSGLRALESDSVVTLEADLHDDLHADPVGPDHTVTLVWLGRRGIAGIATGVSLTAHGRLGTADGRHIIHNPAYELDV